MEGEAPTQASTPTGAVFLSYASEDVGAAERIAAALRTAGLEVWFDKSELRGGDAWDRQIREQIHDCRLFIPIISSNSEGRDEGYFRREWSLAADRTRDMAHKRAFLVPVVIDGTPERGASVPEKFHEVQWTRLPGGETPPEFVERVRRLLSPERPHVPSAMLSPAQPVATATLAVGRVLSRPKRVLPAIAAVVVLGAIAYFAVGMLPKHSAPPPAPTAALASAAQAAFSPPPHSIAVLPFVDLSEKHDQEYFGDGMAEEILDLLSKLPQLTVIGRTSSFQFKGRSADLREIGSKLRVAYVVEGSVRKAGPRVRVTAQLIDTVSGAHVWSDSYDRDYGDVLALQDEIATGITRALQLAVGDTPPARRLQSKDAYTLYLRGLSSLDRQHEDQLAQAKNYFEQALAIDPSLMRAAEALAFTYIAIGIDENIPAITAYQQARAAAQHALRIDARSATAHAVLGFVHAYEEFEWQSAEAELGKALSLNPRDPATLYLASQIAYPRSREAGLARLRTSLALDPLNPYALQGLGQMLRDSGDLAGSDSALRKSLEVSSTTDGSHLYLAQNLLLRRRPEAALAEVQTETAPDARDLGLALVNHALGHHAESDAALTRLTRADAELWPFAIVVVYAYRGEADEAFRWMDKAYELRDDEFIYTVRSHPMLERLRGDPRYKVFLRKMNLPE